MEKLDESKDRELPDNRRLDEIEMCGREEDIGWEVRREEVEQP